MRRAFACLIALACARTATAHPGNDEDLISRLEQSVRDPLLDLDARDLLDRPANDFYVLRSTYRRRPPSWAASARWCATRT